MLRINALASESHRSEQRGFATLLVDMFGTFRNPTAHAPRISWPMSEEDALDLFTLASYHSPSPRRCWTALTLVERGTLVPL